MVGRFAILALAALAAHSARAAEPATVVPFSLHRGHLVVVRGTVGPLADLVLLLDTGAGRTILDAGVGRRLGLHGPAVHVESFGARVPAYETVAPGISLGGRRMGERRVLVSDLAETAVSFDLSRLDGIVGIDLLGTVSFTLDFRRQVLSFGRPGPAPHRVGFVRHPVFLVVPAAVDGRRVHLIVDTGASHLVLFDAGPPPGPASGPAAQPVLLAGSTIVWPLSLDVRIGGWRARQLAGLGIERDPAGASAAGGLLSLQALCASVVQFDLERNELSWHPAPGLP